MSELIAKSGMKVLCGTTLGWSTDQMGTPLITGKSFAARRHHVMARHGNTSILLAQLRTSHAKIHADVKAAMSTKAPAL